MFFVGAQITRPLNDVVVTETKPAVLECHVARDGVQGEWFKDDQLICPTDFLRYQIIRDGCVHKLRISETTNEDKGKYSFKFGSASTSAKLAVTGNLCFDRNLFISKLI